MLQQQSARFSVRTFSRRSLLVAAGGLAGWGLSNKFGAQLPSLDGTRTSDVMAEEGALNDASGLSHTPIHKHITLTQDPGDRLVQSLRAEIKAASAEGRAFNIGAARHSMGGQAIPRDGIAVTYDNGFVAPDTQAGTFRAHAGARWSQVISTLDPLGFSPKVMQSNNDFGVAATYSVNAHGWPVPFGPMGATVRSVRMVLPSLDLVTCSREENAELFQLAMGGYGLVWAIVDMEVEMLRNSRLHPRFDTMPASEFGTAFKAVVQDPEVSMAYGRLNVERASFFQNALLVSYRETEDQADLPAAAGSGWMSHVASRIYRAQLGNEAMKGFRWWNETALGPQLASGPTTRNSLINEPVHTLDDRNPQRTDILHEYFVGFDQFDAFLSACRDVIPASYQEFLNVTLRYVKADSESTLSYAPVDRIAAVMSFSQELTQRGEADMARMTQALIDRIVAIEGAYYLPYRPHARQDQLRACYAGAAQFAAAKRAVDPNLTFRNALWDMYLKDL